MTVAKMVFVSNYPQLCYQLPPYAFGVHLLPPPPAPPVTPHPALLQKAVTTQPQG